MVMVGVTVGLWLWLGVRKGCVHRAIVKFHEPPAPQPHTVCFHFPGTFMTHRYVLDMVRARLKSVDGERVRTIQFVNRNTIHGTQVSTDSHTYIPVHVYLYEHKTYQSHSTDSRASEMELGHIL